jgi:hypothetical protein
MKRTVAATTRERSVNLLSSLPKRRAEFIKPMDCAPVSKLADGPGWVYEIFLIATAHSPIVLGRASAPFESAVPSRRRHAFGQRPFGLTRMIPI